MLCFIALDTADRTIKISELVPFKKTQKKVTPPTLRMNSAVIHCDAKSLKYIGLKFYLKLCIHISIQTPDPAESPISHFHSCSSPCGLPLKIAMKGKGGLNFTLWCQICSSITSEKMRPGAGMIIHFIDSTFKTPNPSL